MVRNIIYRQSMLRVLNQLRQIHNTFTLELFDELLMNIHLYIIFFWGGGLMLLRFQTNSPSFGISPNISQTNILFIPSK